MEDLFMEMGAEGKCHDQWLEKVERSAKSPQATYDRILLRKRQVTPNPSITAALSLFHSLKCREAKHLICKNMNFISHPSHGSKDQCWYSRTMLHFTYLSHIGLLLHTLYGSYKLHYH